MPFIALLLAAAALTPSTAGMLPGTEADDAYLERLAMCEDSWFSWKDDEVRMQQYVDRFTTDFTRGDSEPAFIPKRARSVLGFPLVKVYPQSVGMAVGFSVQLGGTFANIRGEVEHRLGKPLECSTSDGMISCGAELGAHKSLTVTAFGNGADAIHLLGCFYYYEK